MGRAAGDEGRDHLSAVPDLDPSLDPSLDDPDLDHIVDLDPITLADEQIDPDLIVAALSDPNVEITFHAEDSGPLDED